MQLYIHWDPGSCWECITGISEGSRTRVVSHRSSMGIAKALAAPKKPQIGICTTMGDAPRSLLKEELGI